MSSSGVTAMSASGVTVDRSVSPARITFAPGFNVAVPFVDRHVAEGRGGKPAIRSADGDVTYAELADLVNRCGNALLGLGVRRGERLLLVVKDCPEVFYLFWGAIKVGIVPVPLSTMLRSDDYRFVVEDSRCAGVVWSPEVEGEVQAALAAARERPRVALPVEGAARSLRGELHRASPALTPAPGAATAPCFWLYSAGSTGRPKGTVHRHRDLVATSELYGVGILGIGEDDVFLSAPRLFSAYGHGNAMAFPLWAGGTAVLVAPAPTAAATLEAIERFRPTLFFGSPGLYAAQLRELERRSADLSSLRACASAGEPLPAEIVRRWRERAGVALLDGIASTEALHVFVSNRLDDVRPGTSGRIVPGYEARVVVDGKEVPPGEPGRLQVRGPSTAAYYWNDPQKTEATMLEDGWLDTGDTCVRDPDGWLRYCGRSDDILKVGGRWCSPGEIEGELVSHPQVLEAAVVGASDPDGLVKPEAYVVLRDGAPGSDGLARELLRHCRSRLAPHALPRLIHFVQELPRTATGNVQRFRLRQQPASVAATGAP